MSLSPALPYPSSPVLSCPVLSCPVLSCKWCVFFVLFVCAHDHKKRAHLPPSLPFALSFFFAARKSSPAAGTLKCYFLPFFCMFWPWLEPCHPPPKKCHFFFFFPCLLSSPSILPPIFSALLVRPFPAKENHPFIPFFFSLSMGWLPAAL